MKKLSDTSSVGFVAKKKCEPDIIDAGLACACRTGFGTSYGAAAIIACVVKKFLSTAPMLMYQHSCSGTLRPGR